MKKLPPTRTESIVEQISGKEVLLYDLTTNKAYCLNETSSIIYKACNGATTFDELKSKHQFTDDLIYLALEQLQKDNLIDGEPITHFAGMNRREVIRKVGLASMIALPVISSLVAPSAANAASGGFAPGSRALGEFCNDDPDCNNGRCLGAGSTFAQCCSRVSGSNQAPGTFSGVAPTGQCNGPSSACCSGQSEFGSVRNASQDNCQCAPYPGS